MSMCCNLSLTYLSNSLASSVQPRNFSSQLTPFCRTFFMLVARGDLHTNNEIRKKNYFNIITFFLFFTPSAHLDDKNSEKTKKNALIPHFFVDVSLTHILLQLTQIVSKEEKREENVWKWTHIDDDDLPSITLLCVCLTINGVYFFSICLRWHFLSCLTFDVSFVRTHRRTKAD